MGDSVRVSVKVRVLVHDNVIGGVTVVVQLQVGEAVAVRLREIDAVHGMDWVRAVVTVPVLEELSLGRVVGLCVTDVDRVGESEVLLVYVREGLVVTEEREHDRVVVREAVDCELGLIE
eukprot:NODE_7122_length_791_cov_153.944611_g6883_i0.p1 GENE.NODE_7122_length_791_cov_153.944611_g6883_i0~~NODE_7122_length_791_cov_153.944611_g6883_i0.p1  ORF type:complete len:119 (+),score=20.94 NODE_7122_length_791_cov_153.944611_g6883_i0:166-522(+)